MILERLTERIWYYPFEPERDRPNLGYIRGDKWSIAVDAGHSGEHTNEFYEALKEEGLPLPDLTVLTHWHWDHTLGMHTVNGLCLASRLTNDHLLGFGERIRNGGREEFLAFDERIAKEYADGKPVIVTPADIVFSGEMLLDPGGCPVRVFQAVSPHTDDTVLIHAVNESVLFIGDSTNGALPDWKKDAEKYAKLGETIGETGAEICIDGHYTPLSRQTVLDDIRDELAGIN